MTDAPMAPPPVIPGYQFLDVLGSGGFADVHLYEQEVPRRRVAVKVLHAVDFSAEERRQFRHEADLMAQLSTHPSIVTVYHSGTTADDRPFMVMEYCSRPHLGARFRTERIGVDEALVIGIQIAGAVESAHRAGVLHRDIKPANVLVTEYNRPALADFGIASTLAQGAAGRSAGFSVPWSPPESFAPAPWAGPASDVYALGATVYSLLAGRSPFEQAGAENDVASLQARIAAGELQPTGRPDAPASLEEALATALSVSPHARFTSALSFARALQRIQQELGLAVTAVDVIDDGFGRTGTSTVDTDHGRTRIHPADPPAAAPSAAAPSAATLAAAVPSAAAAAGSTVAAAPAGATGAAAGGRDTEQLPPLPPTMTLPAVTAPTEAFGHASTEAATESFAQPAPAYPRQQQAGPAHGPAQGYVPPQVPVEHTVRRAAPAPVPDFGRPAPKKRSVVPGIILDAVLVVGVAGAAAFLVLVR
jgi:hypothetical protein